MPTPDVDVATLTQWICSGRVSARQVAQEALDRIASHDTAIHSMIDVTARRALEEADAIDARRARGERLPPLAGVPYTVKNLFDVEGLVTLAGARVHADKPAAVRDAALVRRMREAGAVLLGTVNMDAYAYGFTTENTHYGATRNPRDISRSAGGSSGGSGAAVAAGFGHFSLCSDTNGSIRVPSSFCGVFGLKPTFGRLSRAGSFPFVPSLDHLGPLARSARDLAWVYDALQGADPDDHACAQRPVEPVSPSLERGALGLRIGVLGGYFDHWADADARAAVARAAATLAAVETVEWPAVDAARAAAFVVTASEAGALYLPALRTRWQDMEPHTRDRLMAGALLPAAWYVRAQRLRRWFADEVRKLFAQVDVLLAPATPCVATPIGSEETTLNGTVLATRPNIGLLTQPVSFIGLPVAVAPLATACGLPIGVQIIAPPWREDWCLRVAWALERGGVAAAPVPAMEGVARVSS